MAFSYVAPTDFAEGSGKWYTHNLALSDDDADPNALSDAITAMSQVFDLYTSDHFLPEPDSGGPDVTLDIAGSGAKNVYVPKRIRSISQVALRDLNGTLTVQDPTAYVVTQSLVNGERTEADLDMISVISGRYLTGTGFWDSDTGYAASWGYWPLGVNAVQLTGQFSWPVTPEPVKRAVALLVYDSIKPSTDVMRRADRWSTDAASFTVATVAPENPTGLPEVDRIVAQFTRNRIPAL